MSDSAAVPASHNPPRRTWAACAGLPQVQVPLARLPAGVVFDDDYPEPIRYDAERRVLCYRGFMSHASYVKLAARCDEREYQTALEQLFVATSPPAPTHPWRIPVPGVVGALVAIAALLGTWLAREINLRRPPDPRPPAEQRVVTLKFPGAAPVAPPPTQPADHDLAEGESRRQPVER